MTDMTRRRLGNLIDTYGANPDRWPEDERPAAEALLARSPEFMADLALAQSLDDAIGDALGTTMNSRAAASPGPSPELRRAILSVPETSSGWRQVVAALWPFDSLLRPAAGLAMAAVLGIALGVSTPPSSLGLSSNAISAASAASDDSYVALLANAIGTEIDSDTNGSDGLSASEDL